MYCIACITCSHRLVCISYTSLAALARFTAHTSCINTACMTIATSLCVADSIKPLQRTTSSDLATPHCARGLNNLVHTAFSPQRHSRFLSHNISHDFHVAASHTACPFSTVSLPCAQQPVFCSNVLDMSCIRISQHSQRYFALQPI